MRSRSDVTKATRHQFDDLRAAIKPRPPADAQILAKCTRS
jgi:hypothetical protein